jgi:hypothetical protein
MRTNEKMSRGCCSGVVKGATRSPLRDMRGRRKLTAILHLQLLRRLVGADARAVKEEAHRAHRHALPVAEGRHQLRGQAHGSHRETR